ncbi:tautomerase family protein [Actinomadura nitritigenes]|uniref:tautomerase family protein n=1 Tax=Actinomadura nitritigenes TaxID=134602 RepID=UPI003D8B439D
MPFVQIHLARGRTAQQLHALAEAVTEAAETTLQAPAAAVRVVITEHEPSHWFVGGRSLTERQTPRQP